MPFSDLLSMLPYWQSRQYPGQPNNTLGYRDVIHRLHQYLSVISHLHIKKNLKKLAGLHHHPDGIGEEPGIRRTGSKLLGFGDLVAVQMGAVPSQKASVPTYSVYYVSLSCTKQGCLPSFTYIMLHLSTTILKSSIFRTCFSCVLFSCICAGRNGSLHTVYHHQPVDSVVAPAAHRTLNPRKDESKERQRPKETCVKPVGTKQM